jgi:predicted nucleic acid-binding protein
VVLVDTSVWIDHFRKANANLSSLLEMDEVAIHPFVLGEVACGNLASRKEIISLLHALPAVTKVEDDELLLFLERYTLMGRGVGLIDVHLLASCHLDGCFLLTKDKRLSAIAAEMRIEFRQYG